MINNSISQKTLFQRFILLFFVFISLIFNNLLFAKTNSQTQVDDPFGSLNQFKSKFEKIGITYKKMGNNIEITTDEQKTLNALPTLVSEGVVSDLDAKVVNKAPLSVSVVIAGISSTLTILNSVFLRDEHLDKVHVDGYVIPIGQTNRSPCYSFDYDRTKFMALDLDILTPRKFLNITPGFAFSDWCKKNIDDEAANL